MLDTITRYMQGVNAAPDRQALLTIIGAIADRVSSKALTNAALVINAASSPLAKIGATDFYAVAKGVLVKKTAGTALAALAGTVSNATFNVFAFFVDSAGVLTTLMGAPAATLAGVRFPQPVPGTALVGFVIVNPTGTGSFVGGTTALDDATVVPNAVYISALSGIDPTILV